MSVCARSPCSDKCSGNPSLSVEIPSRSNLNRFMSATQKKSPYLLRQGLSIKVRPPGSKLTLRAEPEAVKSTYDYTSFAVTVRSLAFSERYGRSPAANLRPSRVSWHLQLSIGLAGGVTAHWVRYA